AVIAGARRACDTHTRARLPPPPVPAARPLVRRRCVCRQVVSALVNIRAEVIHYLEKTFYELTTVALHDWKTCACAQRFARPLPGRRATDRRAWLASTAQLRRDGVGGL